MQNGPPSQIGTNALWYSVVVAILHEGSEGCERDFKMC